MQDAVVPTAIGTTARSVRSGRSPWSSPSAACPAC